MKKMFLVLISILVLIPGFVKAEHWEYKAVGKTTETGDNSFVNLGVVSDGKYVQYYNNVDNKYKYLKYDNNGKLVLENDSSQNGYLGVLRNDDIILRNDCRRNNGVKIYDDGEISYGTWPYSKFDGTSYHQSYRAMLRGSFNNTNKVYYGNDGSFGNVERLSDGTFLANNGAYFYKVDIDNVTASTLFGFKSTSLLDFDIDNEENVYVLNRKSYKVSYKSYYDLYLEKYDLNGNLIWSKKLFEKINDTLFKNLEVLGNEIFVIGTDESTSENGKDVIVYIYDLEGNLKLTKQFAGELDETVSDFVLIDNNNYAFIGTSKSSEFEGIKNEGTSLAYLVTATRVFDIEVTANEGGKYEIQQEGNKGYVIVTPDEKYAVVNVIAKDKDGNEVTAVVDNINKYEFDLDRDLFITIEFALDYDITLDVKNGGEATSEKLEENNGRVKVVPSEGYEIDEVVIKDTTGKEIVYEEKDGIYSFVLTDDVTVIVTFKELPKEVVKDEEEDKEEENPKTADAFIYYASSVVCSLFGIWSVEQYRKNKKEIN